MDITPCDIPEVLLVKTRWFADARGAFSETYNRRNWIAAGIAEDFLQDNHAVSAETGTVRGLHFQRAPNAQSKLIRVVQGAIIDVAVDIRVGSPWYGQAVAVELSAENRQQLYVPKGFAHGYCTLQPHTEVVYKVDAYYAPDCEGGILWNDPALNIAWPELAGGCVAIPRDLALPTLAALAPSFTYQGERS